MRLFFGWILIFLLLSAGLPAQTGTPSSTTEPPLPVQGPPAQVAGTTIEPAPAGTTANTPAVAPAPTAPPPATPAPSAEKLILDPAFKITKVHYVNNTESYRDGGNHALQFEREYWNYGAVTKEQMEALRGQIYVISWNKKGVAENLTARFEYRQINTKDAVFVQTQALSSVTGTNRSTFKVVGADYRKNGPVFSWRFTILRGDKVVALDRSFIW